MAIHHGHILLPILFLILFHCCSSSLISVLEGHTARLPCPIESTSSPPAWVLPNNTILYVNNSTVLEDGTLEIKNITISDAGKYICFQNISISNGKIESLKILKITELRVDKTVALPESERHQSRVINGLIGAAVIAFIVVIPCLVCKFRWEKKERYISTVL